MINYMVKTPPDSAQEDKDLEEIFEKLFSTAMKFCEKYPSQMVAGTYLAIAMRMYKTVLAPEEFKMMMETISDTEVSPYKGPRVH
jgi:hypothetical protein